MDVLTEAKEKAQRLPFFLQDIVQLAIFAHRLFSHIIIFFICFSMKKALVDSYSLVFVHSSGIFLPALLYG